MSSNALVRTAWTDNVFSNINAGENSYAYNLNRTNQSANDIELGYYNKNIDFWEYVVTSTKTPLLMNKYQITFTVELRHTIAVNENSSGVAQIELIDSFRSVNDYVITNLGTKWDNTVDYYEGPQPISITSDLWGGKAVWVGTQIYTAFKLTN